MRIPRLRPHALVPESVRSMEGDTIFDPSLPPTSRFLKSTIISILTFISVMGWLQVVSDAWSILCVMVLRIHPCSINHGNHPLSGNLGVTIGTSGRDTLSATLGERQSVG